MPIIRLMRATYLLIAVNIFVFVMGWVDPLDSWIDLVSYGFSHEQAIHLAFNMFALLTFGLGVERIMGAVRMYWCYLLGIAVGGAAQLLLQPGAPVIGASAGIYALLFAYSFALPHQNVLLLVVPMRAYALLAILVVLEVLCIIFGWLPTIAHWAHLGGATVGYLYWWSWNRKHGQV